MKLTSIRKIEEEFTEDIVCNKCGKSLAVKDESGEVMEFCGIYCNISGGYFNNYIEDGAEYWFDLCEECVVELPAENNLCGE